MRILHVMAGAAQGGAETACLDMVAAMKEAGMDVALATRPHTQRLDTLEAMGIPVHRLPFGGWFDWRTTPALRQIIKAYQPHIVQTWMSRAAHKTPAWEARLGIPRYYKVSRLGGYYGLKYYKTTDYFITITPKIKDYLVAQGIAAVRVQFIPNFAETETEQNLAEPLPLKAVEVPRLLALGRLHPSKGFDTLIHAVALLKQRGQSVQCCIAGEGGERAALTQLITKLGVTQEVVLLGWRQDRAALLAASDLCVFPSRFEPFGTVFIQAWAARVPLVATRSDGPAQFVDDGVTGVLVPIDDAPALAQAIQRVLSDKALSARMVEAGFTQYQQRFTKAAVINAYQQAYHAMLTES